MTSFFGFRNKFSIFIDIIKFVQKLLSLDLYIVEGESCVVHTVKAYFHSHIFDENTLARLHFLISDLDKEAIDALIFAFYDGLSKYDSPICVTGSISNPIFLGGCGGRVDGEFTSVLVINGSSLHFGGVVTVTKFGEAEAPHILKRIDLSHEW